MPLCASGAVGKRACARRKGLALALTLGRLAYTHVIDDDVVEGLVTAAGKSDGEAVESNKRWRHGDVFKSYKTRTHGEVLERDAYSTIEEAHISTYCFPPHDKQSN